MSLKRLIQVLYKEFLRHSCVTAHIRHKDLAIQNFTFSLKVPCVLSLFLSMRQRCILIK